MQIPTQIPSSPPRISGILVSMNHTLKETLHGGDVHSLEFMASHSTFSIIFIIATVWKRQVGEECVTHVVEQDRRTHARLNCYFTQRIKPWNLQI